MAPGIALEERVRDDLSRNAQVALQNELFKTQYDEPHFQAYFRYYQDECRQQFDEVEDDLPIDRHDRITQTIKVLRECRGQSKVDLGQTLGEKLDFFKSVDDITKGFMIAFCLRLWLMINVRDPLDLNFIGGTTTITWEKSSKNLDTFLKDTLYLTDLKAFGTPSVLASQHILPTFCADKLEEQLNIKLVFTDNLADHLKYAENEKELNIFHHTSFLDAQFENSDTIFRKDFIKETLETLNLLFRTDIPTIVMRQNSEWSTDEPATVINYTTSPEWNRLVDDGTRNSTPRMASTSPAQLDAEGPEVGLELSQLGTSPSPGQNPRSSIEYDLQKSILERYPYSEKRMISDYNYYGYRIRKTNELLREAEDLSKSKGIFLRQIHEEQPQTMQWEEQSTNHAYHLSGPPRPLVLSRATRSWAPPFSWRHLSRLRRHNRICPRIQTNLKLGSFKFGYLMVAIFDHHHTANEELIKFTKKAVSEEELFSEIRKAYCKLYGFRRFYSLKALTGFKIYCCDHPNFESHSRPRYNPEGETALAQLYKVYRRPVTWLGSRHGAGTRTAWLVWIDNNLNGGSNIPAEGRTLGLELVISWSGMRIAILTLLLVVSSLVAGIAYTAGTKNHDVQTAWTLASFIVAATGVMAAVLAILRWNRTENNTTLPSTAAAANMVAYSMSETRVATQATSSSSEPLLGPPPISSIDCAA